MSAPAAAGQVEIVDHQHVRPVQPVQVVGQGGDDVGRHLAIEAQKLAGVLSQFRPMEGPSQRVDDGSHKPDPVGVGGITAQPRGWSLGVGGRPVGEKCGLARPGRAHHQGEAGLSSSVQGVEQPGPTHQAGWCAGSMEFRRRKPRAANTERTVSFPIRHSRLPSTSADRRRF